MDMSTVAPLLSMDTGMFVGTSGGHSRRQLRIACNDLHVFCIIMLAIIIYSD